MKDPEAFALQAKHLEGVRSNVETGLQILAAPFITPGGKLSALGVFHPHVTIERVTKSCSAIPLSLPGASSLRYIRRSSLPSIASRWNTETNA